MRYKTTSRSVLSGWGLVVCLAVSTLHMRGRQSETPVPPADTVFTNGHIFTSNPTLLWVEAVAIRDGKILDVGTSKDLAKYRGARTHVVDLGGRMAMPGVIDNHTHFLWGSYGLAGLQLREAKSVEEMKKLALEYAKAHPDEKWVWGSYGYLTPPDRQAKELLDEVFPDRPVSLLSGDGHNLWVNSKALALAGIKRDTRDPNGTARGTIVRDKTGEATGILEEGAKSLVQRLMPASDDEKLRRLKLGLALASQHGVTSIVNATGDLPEMKLYDELRKRGELTVRTTTAFAEDVGIRHTLAPEELADFEKARQLYRDDWVRAGIIKFFADGVIETHTAGMLEPYADTRGQKGSILYTPEEFRKYFMELDRRGFQVMTHAIGDGAVQTVLNAYEAVEKQNGPRDRRWRVEHMEAVAPIDWPRFGKLGVIAAFQPWCCPRLDAGQGKSLGPQRLKESMPWRSIASGGATLSLGSDWPVESLDPFPIMQTALTRQTPDGKPAGGFFPEQNLTLDQVLAGYTRNNAYTEFMEKKLGSLEPGKLADIIVISQDLYKVPPNKVGQTKVLLTMVGGKIVWQEGLN
jgi:predicted amidohydrolase YtcJ